MRSQEVQNVLLVGDVRNALFTITQVINVEGPLVAMAAPYSYRDITGAGAVEVSVELEGPNMLLVTAQLSVAQRLLSAGVLCLPFQHPAARKYLHGCNVL